MNNNYLAVAAMTGLFLCGQAVAADKAGKPSSSSSSAPVLNPCTSSAIEPATETVLGKPYVFKLSAPAARMVRMVVGTSRSGPSHAGKPAEAGGMAPIAAQGAVYDGVADQDIVLLSPTELYFLGKKTGSMNVVLQTSDGRCMIKNFFVTIDPAPLQAQMTALMPEETGIRVKAAESTFVLTGHISDAIKLDHAMSLATSYGDGKRVVNLMRVTAPQQVMLEVKIAEVSKTLIDKLGAGVSIKRSSGGGENTFSLLSNFLSKGGGLIEALRVGKTIVDIDGQKDDGLIRVLAEPNIMAISGQSASFLSGGKIFIPVASSASVTGAAPTLTLEEKEFGIGVKFTPTVLGNSRINLKLVSEVSDLSQTGSPFLTVNNVVTVIPSMSVRRADTTVQLNDGQSFVIAGLIKNNSTEAIKRFPGLGEIPVLGALFRSSEFQRDETELLFVITPRLVKPLDEVPVLPTANHIEPTRLGVYLNGSLEGAAPQPATAPAPATSPVAAAAPPVTAAPAAVVVETQ